MQFKKKGASLYCNQTTTKTHNVMKKIFSTRNLVVLGGILVFAPFVVAVFSLLHF